MKIISHHSEDTYELPITFTDLIDDDEINIEPLKFRDHIKRIYKTNNVKGRWILEHQQYHVLFGYIFISFFIICLILSIVYMNYLYFLIICTIDGFSCLLLGAAIFYYATVHDLQTLIYILFINSLFSIFNFICATITLYKYYLLINDKFTEPSLTKRVTFIIGPVTFFIITYTLVYYIYRHQVYEVFYAKFRKDTFSIYDMISPTYTYSTY